MNQAGLIFFGGGWKFPPLWRESSHQLRDLLGFTEKIWFTKYDQYAFRHLQAACFSHILMSLGNRTKKNKKIGMRKAEEKSFFFYRHEPNRPCVPGYLR